MLRMSETDLRKHDWMTMPTFSKPSRRSVV
jgi:hypothetical protein